MKTTLNRPLVAFALLICGLMSVASTAYAQRTPAKNPDFTKGDPVPANLKQDWNLGPIGARGWMFSDRMVTTEARQIKITQVDPNSPAAEVLALGDVILGVGGKLFSYDPRTEFGKAIGAAESSAGKGQLILTRWREGKTEEVSVQLPVLGDYSPTAPYACLKSKQLLEQGCRVLAQRMQDPNYSKRQDPIVRSLNGLALLASGNREYWPVAKQEAAWAAEYSEDSFQTWRYGYVMIFLAEYQMLTGDDSVQPGLERLALAAANGQSIVGSWGHKFAGTDGRLQGYGMMNSPGIPLTIGLILARMAGVDDPRVAQAIEKSARLIRFYIGKGAVPYGDHHPWIETHEDNGKCGMAAIMFSLLEEWPAAEFFSRMSVASHGAERDTGHTGNFFNMLWAMPAIALAGPDATGAWQQEFGSWYFDFARRWDGSFAHQGPPEPQPDSYHNWDATSSYLLALSLPLKQLHLTGKVPTPIRPFDSATVTSLLNDGRGWDNKDRHSFYDGLSIDELLERLASWSPTVRERAAMALGRRKDVPTGKLIEILASPQLEARYGACTALAKVKLPADVSKEAVSSLEKQLKHEDLWLRIKAADALAAIGDPAMVALPTLLTMLTRGTNELDPRGMEQRYLCFALFDRREGLLRRSMAEVDRELLYQAVRAGLTNQDGRARGAISSVYEALSFDEIKPLLPAVYQATAKPAPSGIMFADEIRIAGIELLAKHRVAEGMSLCLDIMNINSWGEKARIEKCLRTLNTYGSAAKPLLPRLRQLQIDLAECEQAHRLKEEMELLRSMIQSIESSEEIIELKRIEDQPLQVYILVGQSNMQGHADIRTFEHLSLDEATKPLRDLMLNEDGSPKVCERVWISSIGCAEQEQVGQLTTGFGAGSTKIGPEYSFGLAMEKNSQGPILLIKTSWGGKSIHTDFRPPSAGPYVFDETQLANFEKNGKDVAAIKGEKAAATGVNYRLMIEHVQHVLADIKRVVPDYDASQGFQLAGFVWFQGWNDMVDGGTYPNRNQPGGYDAYSEVMAHFIRDVRNDLNAPELPFVIGVLGVGGPVDQYGADEQRYKSTHQNFRLAMAAPVDLPEFKGNVTAVWTDQYWDRELTEAKAAEEKIKQQAKQQATESKLSPAEAQALQEKMLAAGLTERQRQVIEKGISNFAFHYLGSAKILGGIGQAFAEAIMELKQTK